MSGRRVFISPAIKVKRMRKMIERGEFVGWTQRVKAARKKAAYGLPSAKLIEKRMRAISRQLRSEG